MWLRGWLEVWLRGVAGGVVGVWLRVGLREVAGGVVEWCRLIPSPHSHS